MGWIDMELGGGSKNNINIIFFKRESLINHLEGGALPQS